MDMKIVLLHMVLGILTLCVGTPLDWVESSTSTSVSVSTVIRKVTSRSFPGPHHLPNDTQAVTEEMLKIQNHSKEETDEASAKPQKVKKKILVSNLKNASEKVAFPGEKHEKIVPKLLTNATERTESGKPNSSDSSEDEMAEEAKGENHTEVARGEVGEGDKRNPGPVEGRSLEDRSSEENVNVDAKAKTKIASSTTVQTTSSHSYETFAGLQKVLNNNYLNNNEGYDRSGSGNNLRASPSAILSTKKLSPVTKENSLKDAIRFDGEYYGPTGQTDWVPIIPDKLPVRSPASGSPNFGTKLKPPTVDKSNKTNDRSSVVFPADGIQPRKETEKTTRVRSSVHVRVPTSTTERGGTTQPMRPFVKFRGAVRYRPSNSTADDAKSQNETLLKKNISLEIPAMGMTEAPWTLSTVGGPGKLPNREETTEISVVSSTNHTTKSQNADSGLAVPPENVKIENVTKEPQTKIPTVSSDEKLNKSETTSPKIIEGGWIPIKIENGVVKNVTDVDVSGTMLPTSQRNESDTESVKSSTVGLETTPEEATTEEVTATERTPQPTTVPKVSNSAVETSSQSQKEEIVETPATEGNPEEITTLAKGSFPPTATPTVFKTVYPSDADASTEVPPTTTADTNEESQMFVPSTQQIEEVETSEAVPTTQLPVSTVHTATAAATAPKFIPVENSTRTAIPKETTNLKPSKTVMPSTVGTTPTRTSTVWTTSSPPTGTTAVVPTTTMALPKPSTTTTSRSDGWPEEGIYYKNYIPTTMNPHLDITEENVPAYLRLTVQAKDWKELCRLKENLRESIIKMLGGKNVSVDSVHFLNLNDRNCEEKIEETKGNQREPNGTVFLPVNMFLMDRSGDFDKNLSEAFLTLWGRRGLDFELPIRKVDFVTPIVNLTELADPPLGGSVVAAIVISCVAGICVILLGVLFIIMKRRQKRFNYGQRCTPVSLDAYSLDSVSIYNSVRRKDVRASKRSYGNAAFDDPEVPTHPMNFAGLANFSSDKEQLHEEFNIIPQVYPKVEELPAGAETKNRYANIIPLPETRVHLSPKDGDPLSYYINANYVRGSKGAEKVYIACQAPMESTVEDFWRMIWEQQCKVILMLTDLQENGIEKCADYLPPNEVTDNLRLFGDFQVTLKKRDVKEKYIISNLKLKNMEANLWREVTHLWYLGWPDQGVPSEANSLIAFLIEARSQLKIQNGATAPGSMVVHCSPGTGRTGTVIACDLCIREYEQSRMVDIPRCVFNLRRDRAGAVQTKDQYAFIYQVLNVYATKLSGGGIESI